MPRRRHSSSRKRKSRPRSARRRTSAHSSRYRGDDEISSSQWAHVFAEKWMAYCDGRWGNVFSANIMIDLTRVKRQEYILTIHKTNYTTPDAGVFDLYITITDPDTTGKLLVEHEFITKSHAPEFVIYMNLYKPFENVTNSEFLAGRTVTVTRIVNDHLKDYPSHVFARTHLFDVFEGKRLEKKIGDGYTLDTFHDSGNVDPYCRISITGNGVDLSHERSGEKILEKHIYNDLMLIHEHLISGTTYVRLESRNGILQSKKEE